MGFRLFIGIQLATTFSHLFPIPVQETLTVSQEELQATPLFQMPDVPKTFATLFGDSQADVILKKWNTDLKLKGLDSYLTAEQIRFPLIYPDLKNSIPSELSDLRRMISFSEPELQVFDNPHLIIVLHTDHEKSALAYYQDQKLKLATFVSLGKKSMKTKAGVFSLKHDKIFRRSYSFNGAPMPYAMQYSGPYFLHWGEGWGEYASHGCVRVPWLYQKWLYENLPSKGRLASLIVHKPYEVSLLVQN